MIDLPETRRDPPAQRRSLWRNLSFIWLVPLGALAVVLWIAWENYSNRGALIEITFQNASGIVASETTLRYRDVVVGTVEEVSFSEGLADVQIGVRVDNQIVPYLDEDAQFWVVRPEVSAQGISGLSTVLSGVYIAAAWDLEPGTPRTVFEGGERPPLAQPGLDGVQLVLSTRDGLSVSSGAPVLYRGLQVGRLEQPRLTNDGETILVEAFIEAPYDQLVTSATRFWDTSGFTVSLGAGGLSLNVDSLASLVSGGVSFDRIYDDGTAVVPGQVFALYESESEARRRPFLAANESSVDFVVRFSETATGLSSGADVLFAGTQVGQVVSLRTELQPGAGDRGGVALGLSALVRIDPQLMGLPPGATREEVVSLMRELVDGGLRAQLASQGLLGGDLAIALVELPEAEPAALLQPEDGPPEIPGIPRDPSDFAAAAQGLLNRVSELPLDEVVNRAISLMDSVETFLRQDSIQQVPESLVTLIEDTRALVLSEDMQALPGELRASVQTLSDVVIELELSEAVSSLTAALDAAATTAGDVSRAVEGLPDLVTELAEVARTAVDLPLQDVVARVDEILTNANALITSEEAKNLPVALTGALEQVEAALGDTRALILSEDMQALPGELRTTVRTLSDTVAEIDVTEALASLTAALDAAAVAAGDVSSAVEGVPDLIDSLNEVARTATDLPLQDMVRQVEAVLESANALISSEDTRNLPVALTGALEQVEAALAELRAGGTVDNVNLTLASARDAAGSVARAADDLPELTRRLNQLVAQAETLAGSYDAGSAFNAQTLRAIREISDAARAVTQLAREIERNPNSLLFGR